MSNLKVKSLIEINDKRGNIKAGDEGHTTSIIPHSDGLYPVWFDKHKKHVFWFPLFLKTNDVEFIK